MAWRDARLEQLGDELSTSRTELLRARSREAELLEAVKVLRRQTRRWQDGQRPPWDLVDPTTARSLVESSGLFDPAFYLSQLPPAARVEAERDPLGHFFAASSGTPHPLFDPDFWVDQARANRMAVLDPAKPASVLAHYLTHGRGQGLPTHPLLERVDRAHPARKHPGGLPAWTAEAPDGQLTLAAAAAAFVSAPSTPTPHELAVVLLTDADRTDGTLQTLHRVREVATVGTHVHVVLHGLSPAVERQLRSRAHLDDMSHSRAAPEEGASRTTMEFRRADAVEPWDARAEAVQDVRAPVVIFLSPGAKPEGGWDRALMEALTDADVVQPLILDSSGATWSAGADVTPAGDVVLIGHGLAGNEPWLRTTRSVPTTTDICLAVRTERLRELRGHDAGSGSVGSPRPQELATDERPALCVGAARVVLPQRGVASPTARDLLGSRSPGQVSLRDVGPPGSQVVGYRRAGSEAAPLVPLLVRERLRAPLRWSLKIPATYAKRELWGDWCFATSLARALERRGQHVSIDCRGAWTRDNAHLDDVVLSLRGTAVPPPLPGQVTLCWVISHPEDITAEELRGFDLLFAASVPWAEQQQRTLGRPVVPLLQCTDAELFSPVEPDPDLREDVLVVASNRPTGRPAVTAAQNAGLNLAVYGLGWDGVLPATQLRSPYLDNRRLHAHYAAAGAVLADHWEDMRRHGFVANRLFDIVASGGRAVSDEVPGLRDLFGDAVRVYDSPEDLVLQVRDALDERDRGLHDERARRVDAAEMVRRDHSFDVRARELVDAVRRFTSRGPGPHQHQAG